MMKILVVLVALAAAACASVPPQSPRAFVLRNVSVIDPATGAIRPEQSVRVEGERIAAVGPNGSVATRGARIVDGSGKFLVPGLWDMHVHLQRWKFETAFPMFVANGVLGVRDMGSEGMAPARAAIEQVKAGRVPSVRLFATGLRLDGPTNPLFTSRLTVRTPEEGRAAVREKAEEGVSFIKVMSALDKPTFMAIAEEARARNIRFTGHLPRSVSGIEAANAGMWTIEHGNGIPSCEQEPCPARDATIEAFKRNGIWQVPTLAAEDGQVRIYSGGLPPEEQAYVTEYATAVWDAHDAINTQFYPPVPERLKAFQANVEGGKRLIGLLHRNGVRLLAGTDLGGPGTLPGFSLHRQLELMVEAGLSPLEALRTATSNAVAALGVEKDLGSVEAGKYADFLILNRNPLQDIRGLRDMYGVVSAGRAYLGEERSRLLSPWRRQPSTN